ncbi:MAG: hypothetical protein ABI673_00560 [Novosphingobium sp.]
MKRAIFYSLGAAAALAGFAQLASAQEAPAYPAAQSQADPAGAPGGMPDGMTATPGVYPPCSATLQDQCTNTRPEADYKGGPPQHNGHRYHQRHRRHTH